MTHFQGVEKGSMAYKLMASMGWQEGQGLGSNKQGMTSHVKVKKKFDSSGVGAAQEAAVLRDWTIGMAAYDKVLAALRPVDLPASTAVGDGAGSLHESKKTKRKKDKVRMQISSEAAAEPDKKKRKKQKRDESEASRQDAQPVLQSLSAKRATHVGRFHKRAAMKAVNGYSSTDLAAILGERQSAEAGDQAHQQSVAQPKVSLVVDLTPVIRPATPPSSEAEPANPSDSAEAVKSGDGSDSEPKWWHSIFAQGGRSGSSGAYGAFSSKQEQREVNIAGFSEQDQANLWQNVTDAQSKSRKGLGQGSGPLKVAGAQWKGTKKIISESEDEKDDAGAGGVPRNPVPQPVLAATVVSSAELGGNSASGAGLLKWRMIAKGILAEAADHRMRRKEFFKQAWKVAVSKGAVDKDASLEELVEYLQKSKIFAIDKKSVQLLEAK